MCEKKERGESREQHGPPLLVSLQQRVEERPAGGSFNGFGNTGHDGELKAKRVVGDGVGVDGRPGKKKKGVLCDRWGKQDQKFNRRVPPIEPRSNREL